MSKKLEYNTLKNKVIFHKYKTSKILGQISIIHENIDSISEIFNTITNMMTNTNIGVLTVLTVVIWIMTMISGIYWMNIDLPFQNDPQAFSLLICWMCLLALATLLIFKKKKRF